MVENIFEYIVSGTAPSAEGDVSGLANRLRRREALSQLDMMSGDPVMAPIGARESKAIRQEADQVRESALTRARQEAQDRRLAAQQAAAERRHQDRMGLARANMEMRKLARNKIPRHIMEGLETSSKHRRVVAGLRNEILGPGGEIVYRPGSEGKLPGQSSVENLAARWGMGDEATKKKADYFRRLKYEMELAARHELFGSALTAQETAQWQQAFLSAEMTTEQILGVLNSMDKIYSTELNMRKQGAIAQGYDRDVVEIYGSTASGQDEVEIERPQEPPRDTEVDDGERILVEGEDF